MGKLQLTAKFADAENAVILSLYRYLTNKSKFPLLLIPATAVSNSALLPFQGRPGGVVPQSFLGRSGGVVTLSLTDHRLPVTDYRFPLRPGCVVTLSLTDHRLPVTDYRFPLRPGCVVTLSLTDHRLPVTDYRFPLRPGGAVAAKAISISFYCSFTNISNWLPHHISATTISYRALLPSQGRPGGVGTFHSHLVFSTYFSNFIIHQYRRTK
jgi:hypothetical protein